MKLFYVPGACSLAPQIVLQELGTPYEAIRVNPSDKSTSMGDYTKINPKGSVPSVLLDNGQLLTEAAIIMQYLCDQKPESGLFPKLGTWERYQAMEWMNYISTDLHKGFGPIFASDRWFPNKPEIAAEIRSIVTKNLARPLGQMNTNLSKHPFVLGQTFSACDAYLYVVLGWAKHKSVDLSAFPELLGFHERVASRPAVRKAHEIEK